MKEALLKELTYLTSRSSGPGGQHVNKTESKVELRWNLDKSNALSEEKKEVLRKRLGKKLSTEGELIMYSQETRSQLKNKEIVTNRFLELIERMLRPRKRRISTKPRRSAVEKRLKDKKENSEKKRRRGEF